MRLRHHAKATAEWVGGDLWIVENVLIFLCFQTLRFARTLPPETVAVTKAEISRIQTLFDVPGIARLRFLKRVLLHRGV